MQELAALIIQEQQKINQLRPPQANLAADYAASLTELAELRGRNLIYPYLSSGRGHGPFTQLADGSVKYDLVNGIGVNLLGHGHKAYIEALLENAAADIVTGGNLLPYPEPYALSKTLLAAVSQTRLKHLWFACSGSMANEQALKVIWQKRAPRTKILAFRKCFAGRSVAMEDITDYPEDREGMPNFIDVTYVDHFDHDDPTHATQKTLEQLEQAWQQAPDQYAALMIEIIQGQAGFIFGPREYYVAIMDWAVQKGIPIWVDEIQTFGRTRALFAFQMFGLDKYVDVVTAAKVIQCGVTMYSEEFNPRPGLLGGTFVGSLASLNAGNHIIQYLLQNNFYGPQGKFAALEQAMLTRLQALANGTCKNLIHHIRGVGAMISFEVGDSSAATTRHFLQELFKAGIIAFSGGRDPVRVRLLPSIDTNHPSYLQEIFTIFEKVLLATIKPAKSEHC
jgi:4-aminobutyrate aminotransferase-like enzyme